MVYNPSGCQPLSGQYNIISPGLVLANAPAGVKRIYHVIAQSETFSLSYSLILEQKRNLNVSYAHIFYIYKQN